MPLPGRVVDSHGEAKHVMQRLLPRDPPEPADSLARKAVSAEPAGNSVEKAVTAVSADI
jgi:hypothetical protein